MIRSMTGYGSAEGELLGQRLTAQIQSVNHRFCEVGVRLPRSLAQFENPLRSFLQQRFTRGKIIFQAAWEGREDPGRRLRVDRERARAYVEELRALGGELGVGGELDLATLINLPEVLVFEGEEMDEKTVQAVLDSVAEKAVADLVTMREREGEALRAEFERALTRIGELVDQAEKKSAGRPEEIKEKLLARIQPLLGEIEVDATRVAQEVAFLAERLDTTEEFVRLRAHIAQFRDLAAAPEPVGRKLNFLLQEMNREANTLGSKSNDAELAAIVIEIKDELEKVREQVQNVE